MRNSDKISPVDIIHRVARRTDFAINLVASSYPGLSLKYTQRGQKFCKTFQIPTGNVVSEGRDRQWKKLALGSTGI